MGFAEVNVLLLDGHRLLTPVHTANMPQHTCYDSIHDIFRANANGIP